MKKFHFILKLFLLTTIYSLSVSCQNDDNPVVYEDGSNAFVNNWINQEMKKYYFWNEKIPDNISLSLNPKEYFQKLLYTDDFFSYAINTSLPETLPKSIRSSFGFDISFIKHEGQIYGVILYVLADSPAQRTGLKRGQFIKKIEGILLNDQNYEDLYLNLANSDLAQLQVIDYTAAMGFSAEKEIEILRGLTFSQPVQYSVITNKNEKAGYIEIPHFDIGLAPAFLKIFNEFKNQAVTKVIIDLRYNGGGDVAAAAALSIILAPNIKSDDLFITFKGNKNGGMVNKSFQEALEMNESQISFQALRAVHPPIQDVYVLCGTHTASASEIIINNLKPFMNVVTIGEKTVGKDLAGFAIESNDNSSTKNWILYPVIYKLFNAKNEGNYAMGINPVIELNELQEMEIFPLGDSREKLLNQALTKGLNTNAKPVVTVKTLPLKMIHNDADPFLKIRLK